MICNKHLGWHAYFDFVLILKGIETEYFVQDSIKADFHYGESLVEFSFSMLLWFHFHPILFNVLPTYTVFLKCDYL